jgi:hypothetical protein
MIDRRIYTICLHRRSKTVCIGIDGASNHSPLVALIQFPPPLLPQVTYACRYPGQHKPLHKPGTGEGGGRVLSDEGKLWQEKILAGEVGRIHR